MTTWSDSGTLTKRQEEVLRGLLLGDGHLSIGRKARNPRLRINRAAVDLAYQTWTRDEFTNLCSPRALRPDTVWDERYQKFYGRISLCTRRSPAFLSWHQVWYPEGKRVLPSSLQISPLTAAVWFADDGSLYHKNGNGIEIALATASFGKEGSARLAELLNQTLNTHLFRVYGGYKTQPQYKILSATDGAREFVKYIREAFPPVPRKQSAWDGADRFLDPDVTREPCPRCGSAKTFKNGIYKYGAQPQQKYCCRGCSNTWRN
jgi:hypothetical protein